GELGCFGKDRSETTPFMFKHQQLGPSSLVSSWTKHQTGDQGCLVREVRMTDPSSVVLDVRQCYVEENQDLMRVESKLDTGTIVGRCSGADDGHHVFRRRGDGSQAGLGLGWRRSLEGLDTKGDAGIGVRGGWRLVLVWC
ncbi:hypothetical protein U1Q18_014731, partial [Sarracenia purpurea var. burkii]